MRAWLADRHFRSLLKNSGYLAAAKVVAAVASLATLALAGRALGLVEFGILILITSYAQAASGIAQFQSWQVVIRYGSNADDARLREAIGFSFGLDLASALAGTLLAVLAAGPLASAFGIPENYVAATMLYCLVLPAKVANTPTGVLRLFDRFDLISLNDSLIPIFRLVMAVAGFMLGWDLGAFLLFWAVSEVLAGILLWTMALAILRRQGVTRALRPRLRGLALERPWRFAIDVNLASSLKQVLGPIARLIVGGILGPVAAGLFRVASTIATSAAKPSDVLAKAFFPEVMKMDFSTADPWRLMLRAMAAAGGIALLAWLLVIGFGEWVIDAAFGAQFTPAYPVLVILMIVPLIQTLSFPMPSTLYALDRSRVPLIAQAIGAIAFVGAVYPLGADHGIEGAGWAFVGAHALMLLVLSAALWREYRFRSPLR